MLEAEVITPAPVAATCPADACASPRVAQAALTGTALYDSGMFCCETVLTVANEAAGSRLPAEVMSLGSGFWGGMAGDGSTCGALVGAIMAVGLMSGRTAVDGAWEESTSASDQVRKEFSELFGGTTCDAIIRPFGGMETDERHKHCAALTGQTSAMVVRIAEERGWL